MSKKEKTFKRKKESQKKKIRWQRKIDSNSFLANSNQREFRVNLEHGANYSCVCAGKKRGGVEGDKTVRQTQWQGVANGNFSKKWEKIIPSHEQIKGR